MNRTELLNLIDSRLGIKELNKMQNEVLASRESNLVLLSPTGSGKTVAFTAAMLISIGKPMAGKVSAVVIAPSRELVLQIWRVVRELSVGMKVVALYGGHSMIDEKNSLTPTPSIIVATPGRLLDHVNRGNVDLSTVKVLVLDEYDKSLELGFKDEMSRLVKKMSHAQRTFLISATRLKEMPAFMQFHEGATLDFLTDSPTSSPADRMQVVEVECPSRDKLQTLSELLHSLDNGRTLIFVNHRESAERVWSFLRKEGFPVGIYHGGLQQQDREKAVDLLNNGTTPVLVCTDLGARGLDIDSVKNIIHYHIPLTAEAWTHRNGRTARQSAHGTIYVLTSEADDRPDYIRADRSYVPTGVSSDPIGSKVATVHFNAGKKEKLSRGDIAGFLIKQVGIEPDKVGLIVVRDHNSLAAIPEERVKDVIGKAQTERIKGKRVRVTQMKP